jgi:serine/threonine-protein kinase
MFTADGSQPVIIDFGTAGLRGHREDMTTTTLLAGSFHYMAPERLTGRYSPASDVYSLGVIVLEMLTAKRLDEVSVSYTHPAFGRELRQILLSSIDASIATEFANELLRAYDPEPRNRPRDVALWCQALSDLLERP